MKRNLTLIFPLALLGVFCMGCSSKVDKEQTLENEILPVKMSGEQISFFETHLPSLFENNETRPILDTDSGNVCFVSNSIDELQSFFSPSIELPPIDFEKYTLVWGFQAFPTLYYRVANQSISEVDVRVMKLTLNVSKPDGAPDKPEVIPFFGLYNKLQQKTVIVKLIINAQ